MNTAIMGCTIYVWKMQWLIQYETWTLSLCTTWCTPPVCHSLSSATGKSGKYPFYVVLKGKNAGIYVDWGVSEGYKDDNVVAEGCNTEAKALSKWWDLGVVGQGPRWANAQDLVSTGMGYDSIAAPSASKVTSAHVKQDSANADGQDGVIHFLIDSPHGRTSAHAKYMKAYEKDKRTTMQSISGWDKKEVPLSDCPSEHPTFIDLLRKINPVALPKTMSTKQKPLITEEDTPAYLAHLKVLREKLDSIEATVEEASFDQRTRQFFDTEMQRLREHIASLTQRCNATIITQITALTGVSPMLLIGPVSRHDCKY
ncbi:hypothetical protein C8J56DRAFT_902782 [Mycena floridula]|nr:hypothetical protein C8J56DRAFT_902782 [Mycena floridula]